MEKLSSLYRNDDVTSLDPDVRAYLDAEFLPTLENMNAKNPKVLVVFSGGNAMGKSSLSAKISKELQGIVIENDAIKRAIIRRAPDIDSHNELNPLTWKYSMDLYNRLPSLTANGLIIRDSVIDWYFDRILTIFEDAGYRIFIVQYEISKERAKELIEVRGDTPTVTTEHLLAQIEEHAFHQQRFRAQYSADVILDESHIFDYDQVIEKLKLVIDELSPTTA